MTQKIGTSTVVIAIGLACTPRASEPSVAPAVAASQLGANASQAAPAVTSTPATVQFAPRRKPHPMPVVPVERRAVTQQPVTVPKPWPEEWCLSHASVWSPELEKKYVQPDRPARLDTRAVTDSRCGWGYNAGDWEAGLDVGLGALKQWSLQRPKARFQPPLGTVAYKVEQKNRFGYIYWNTDPPYLWSALTKEPTPDNKRKVASVTKDMIKRLTAERLSYPMAQISILGADRTGHFAHEVLSEWEYLAPIFAHVAPLAPGYPRLAKGAEFSADPGKGPAPEDQFLLLGVCLPPEGWKLASLISYLTKDSGDEDYIAETYVVDAKALTFECPTALQSADSYNLGALVHRPDGTTFHQVYSLGHKDDPVLLRGAAMLRDKEQHIVDTVLYEIPRPLPLQSVPGRYQQIAHRKLLSRCGAYPDEVSVQATCDVEWSDLICKHSPESTGGRIEFRITEDQRIELKSSEVSYPGDDCVARE